MNIPLKSLKDRYENAFKRVVELEHDINATNIQIEAACIIANRIWFRLEEMRNRFSGIEYSF